MKTKTLLTAPIAGAATGIADDGAMSIPEASTFLKISKSEIYRRLDNGDLQATRIGKRRLILKRSAVALLEKGMTGW